jgi:hypothetical protein
MARTIRVFWPNKVSGWVNFNWTGAINVQSVFHISVCEGDLPDRVLGTELDQIRRFRGEATMFVRNIHPHAEGGGGVEFFVEIDWPNPLNIVTDITVDVPEVGFIVR